jgi:hypothetical protein
MKRIAITAMAIAGLFSGVTLISNVAVRGDDNNLTGRDLDAIYTYLSAIPAATAGSCTGAGQ